MTDNFYSDFRDVPEECWKWGPHFTPEEMACCGSGALLIVPDALDALMRARRRIGTPFHILSAYRSVEHNRIVGGTKHSQHLLGTAFDIALTGHNVPVLLMALIANGFGSFGLYPSFVHVDTRIGKWWIGD